MEKIIQIACCAASNGHSLYALTTEGKVYERVYYENKGVASEWKEIKEKVLANSLADGLTIEEALAAIE